MIQRIDFAIEFGELEKGMLLHKTLQTFMPKNDFLEVNTV